MKKSSLLLISVSVFLSAFFIACSTLNEDATGPSVPETLVVEDEGISQIEFEEFLFDLPSDWEEISKETDENGVTTARIQVPSSDELYNDYLVLLLSELVDLEETRVGEPEPLAVLDNGVKIYTESCGGCWRSFTLDGVHGSNFSVGFIRESEEPDPADLDGPWMPDIGLDSEDLLEFLKTMTLLEESVS